VLVVNSTAHYFNRTEIPLRRFNMKHILIAAAVAAFTITPAVAGNAGVPVNIGQPDFYGRIDIVDFPQPQVIFVQPMIITRGPIKRPPIYMHVPPTHARHWSKHCSQYAACGESVFFVQDNWYDSEYVPRYQERHGNRQVISRNDDRGNQGNGQRGDGKD
jgi:hypothetical protein